MLGVHNFLVPLRSSGIAANVFIFSNTLQNLNLFLTIIRLKKSRLRNSYYFLLIPTGMVLFPKTKIPIFLKMSCLLPYLFTLQIFQCFGSIFIESGSGSSQKSQSGSGSRNAWNPNPSNFFTLPVSEKKI